MYSRREVIFIGSTTGILSALAAYLGTKAAAPPKPTPPTTQAYSYQLKIRGGYAWLFQNGAKPSIRLMCLKAATCSDNTQFLDHKMRLIVPKASVTVDASSVPSMDGGMGRVYWELDGPSMFTKGMAANGVD